MSNPHQKLEIAEGIRADARKALFIEPARTLVVADLHLGYSWSHRSIGNLLPVQHNDDTLDRLNSLINEYRPQETILLGDIVHSAVSIPAIRAELSRLQTDIGSRTRLVLLEGNHDRRLQALLGSSLRPEYRVDNHLLLHGDCRAERDAISLFNKARRWNGRIIIGHEHPAVSISDFVAHHVRTPCFLVSSNLIVLPAFSAWTNGGVARGNYLSHLTKASPPEAALAILAGKLLRIPI